MSIPQQFTVKGGGRNRARRRRRAARRAHRYPHAAAQAAAAERKAQETQENRIVLSFPWNPVIARVALRRLERSGLSQRAFAQANGFPVSRIPTWRKRLEVDSQV
jgi:hypothetical protein